MWKKSIGVCLMSICVSALQAKVVLPAFFTDNMVLQQQSKVTFSGLSNKNKEVTVKVEWNRGKLYRTQSDENGKWSIEIDTPKAGGPYNITFSDGEQLELRNVLLGEVWLCSGQSNMEMPVAGWGKVMNYVQEIKNANYPSIRLFQVKKSTALFPKEELESTMGGWQECSSATIPEFSALGYFYARQLWDNLGIPVGVIDCTWGGTPAEAWMSIQAVNKVMGFEEIGETFVEADGDEQKIIDAYQHSYQNWYARFMEADKGMDADKPIWSMPDYDDNAWKKMTLPVYWEKETLPNFDGTVWFRREIQIPSHWANKDLTLSLGVIDDEDFVYLNGEQVASGAGFSTPRVYTIPADKVKPGKSVLAIRVLDSGGEGGIAGNSEALFMSVEGESPIALNGEWKYRVGANLKEVGSAPVSPTGSSSYPTVLYNAMVHPLTSLSIKGVIWYQGEANVGRDTQYELLFQSLIRDWRNRFRKPEMPFYFVQLANFMKREPVQPDSEWAALREAQSKALHMDHTAMATIIDIGEAEDIHPKNKQEVGRRLALCALAHTYGKKVTASAPQYKTYQVQGDKVFLSFDQVKDGFDMNRTLKGFIMAGPDQRFYEASAYVDGNQVVVECPEVRQPIAVRYGWADNPECTLFSKSGLPVAPFRTDNWK